MAGEAVAADDGGFAGRLGDFLEGAEVVAWSPLLLRLPLGHVARVIDVLAPVGSRAVGVERPMVRRLAHRVVHIIVLENVPAVHAVVDIDPGAGAVIDVVVGDADAQAVGDEHPAALLGEHAHVVDQIVRRLAVHGDIVVRKLIPAPPVIETARGHLERLSGR